MFPCIFSALPRCARNPPLTQPSVLARKHRKGHVRKAHIFSRKEKCQEKDVRGDLGATLLILGIPGKNQKIRGPSGFCSKIGYSFLVDCHDRKIWELLHYQGFWKYGKHGGFKAHTTNIKKSFTLPPGVKTGQPLPRLFFMDIGWQPTKTHGWPQLDFKSCFTIFFWQIHIS